ncbi:MAG TPA: low molecular weight protein-tyrosine-phosphatase [Arachnia sp.]|nr:low molecular weight protein-tyrosine-phosphatase [Arachnia sp.]HMT85835.1 low molecular weight protein-tyrosine-phosphatase [Arachnia sp.]
MNTLVFVCHGNICRSPMAERVARRRAAERGLELEIVSFGVSNEEEGNPIDRRAARVLSAAGYDASTHRARRITRDDIEAADLVVAAEPHHVARLRRLAPDAENLALLNDFNPALPKGTPLDDPWYGPEAGFLDTLADIEAAMDAILDEATAR